MNGWQRRVVDVAIIGAALLLELVTRSENSAKLRDGFVLPAAAIPVAAVLIAATLLWRHRWPVPVFAVAVTYCLTAILVAPRYQPFAALLIALFAVARLRPRREAGLALAVAVAIFGGHAYNAAVLRDAPIVSTTLVGWVIWAGVAIGIWVFGRFGFTAALRARQLERAHAEGSARAVQVERLRLARELHDIVAHSVSAMILQAAGAKAITARPDSAERVSDALQAIETTGVQAMRELHRLLGLLRSADGDADHETGPAATLADLDLLLQSTRQAGVDVELRVDGDRRPLDPSVEHAAFRVVQESLANVIKHAGRGASAQVDQCWRPQHLTLTIRSAAGEQVAAAAAVASGFGLRGLAERIALVGGTFDAAPVRTGGFLVRAELPLRVPSPQLDTERASAP